MFCIFDTFGAKALNGFPVTKYCLMIKKRFTVIVNNIRVCYPARPLLEMVPIIISVFYSNIDKEKK